MDYDSQGGAQPPHLVLKLPRHVYLDGHLIPRSALPESHPESWPSKYQEATGKKIPEGWQEDLRVHPRHL